MPVSVFPNEGVTVAVKVTDPPDTDGLRLEVITVVVGIPFQFSIRL